MGKGLLKKRKMASVNILKKCKFCPVQFSSNEEYLLHIEKIHQGKSNNFMCSDCGKQYKTKSELTHHIQSKCGTLKQFTCKVCGQVLMSTGSLYNHMLRHKGERSFMCRFCAKLFLTAGQLKVHERIHTQDKAYICDVCNKGFCHRQSLITHSTIHTGIKPFQCENCGNSFSCVGNLIKHRKTHADTCGQMPLTTHRVKHPSTKIKLKINTPVTSKLKALEKDQQLKQELESLKTEIELEQNRVKSNLIDQIVPIAQEEGIPPFCAFQLANNVETSKQEKVEEIMDINENHTMPQSSNEVSDHNSDDKVKKTVRRTKKRKKKDSNFEKDLEEFVNIWNLEGETNLECKFCKKTYSKTHWLFKHVKEHGVQLTEKEVTKIPCHKCSWCKQSFLTKEELLEHQQTAHSDKLTCQDCDKTFKNRNSFHDHIRIFHKGAVRKTYLYICEKCGRQFRSKVLLTFHENNDCSEGPFYDCSICKKQFTNKQTRDNHMRVHDPEKKLLCRFCAKSFRWKGQLKIHERTHTGEKPFTCLYCPKAFAYRDSLITHSTLHTGIKPHFCEACGSRFSCIGNLIKHRSRNANECGAWTYKTKDHTAKDGGI